MPVTGISVEGLRGFQVGQAIEPAIPNGEAGSGLTVIVGPNNSGKSTMLEALRAMMSAGDKNRSFPDRARNVGSGSRVRISLSYGPGQVQHLQTAESGGSETVWRHEGSFTPTPLLVIPSRRAFPSHFERAVDDRVQYQLRLSGSGRRPTTHEFFGNRLFRIEQGNNRRKFDDVLSRVLSPTPRWYIEQQGQGEYYLRLESGKGHHDSEGLGDGVLSLFVIVDALYDSRPGELIAIDEPELSLHPALQRKLAEVLCDFSRDRQIIICTHSPYFVDPARLAAGCRLVRAHPKNGGSNLCQLTAETGKRLARLTEDLNNPHAVGLDAREALFLGDGIILFEGQEDVRMIGLVEKQAGVQICGTPYGWGVGGAGKMRLLATLFRELGFQRVVGVLDADKAESIPGLQADFPDFFFGTQPAKDIRTKDARTLSAVRGLLDEKHHLRGEYVSETVCLLESINAYLSGQADAYDLAEDQDRIG